MATVCGLKGKIICCNAVLKFKAIKSKAKTHLDRLLTVSERHIFSPDDLEK